MENAKIINLDVPSKLAEDYEIEKDRVYMKDCWAQQDWNFVEKSMIERICRKASRNGICVHTGTNCVTSKKYLDDAHVAVILAMSTKEDEVLLNKIHEENLIVLQETNVYMLDHADSERFWPVVYGLTEACTRHFLTETPCHAYLVYGDKVIDKVQEIKNDFKYILTTKYALGNKYAEARAHFSEFIRWSTRASLMKVGINKLQLGDYNDPHIVHKQWQQREQYKEKVNAIRTKQGK